MKIRGKMLTGICSVIVIVIALSFSRFIEQGNNQESYFKWFHLNPHDTVIQVTTGKTVVVPFEFKVEGRVSEMRLAIRDDLLKGKGISLEATVIPVRNGVVSSNVIFNIRKGSGIKAGRYYLANIARDTATGQIIREGEILFALDLLDLIWRCSC
jgi:hypothetical protein